MHISYHLVCVQKKVPIHLAERFDRNIEKNAFRLELVTDEDGNDYILWHGYEDGNKVTFETDPDPYTSIWQRMGVGFMRIMPIESQL